MCFDAFQGPHDGRIRGLEQKHRDWLCGWPNRQGHDPHDAGFREYVGHCLRRADGENDRVIEERHRSFWRENRVYQRDEEHVGVVRLRGDGSGARGDAERGHFGLHGHSVCRSGVR